MKDFLDLRMKIAAFLAPVLSTLASQCLAQTPPDTMLDLVAVTANNRAYEAAYARRDVTALAGFFAEDAVFTAEDGRTSAGRTEIENAIREGLRANPGATLSISVHSVRAIAPEVVLENGLTSVTATSGEASAAKYAAVHVKKNGGWKISQLVESRLPEVPPRERLSELEWLIGRWAEDDPANGVTVDSHYTWARGGNFLTRNVQVVRGGEVTLDGWQIIGWDPVEEQIHSWTFDTEGGFAEGFWTREGERWLVRETGVAPDGSRTSADNTLTKLGGDRLAWESNNRTLNGEPQPNISRIEASRVKGP